MTNQNNAAQAAEQAIKAAIRKAYDDGYNDAKMAPDNCSTYCVERAVRLDSAALLSKLRAPVADERAAFLAWASKEYGIAEGYELNESNRDLLENQKGWMARAALASAPVAGEATYHAVMHGNALFGVFDTEAAADACIAKALYPPSMSVRPLYAAPQASEAECSCPSGNGSLRHPCAVHPASEAACDTRMLIEKLEAWQAVCDRIVDQYGGVVGGVDFVALGRANRAALSAQPGAQLSGNSGELGEQGGSDAN